jgi:hypothetical protein
MHLQIRNLWIGCALTGFLFACGEDVVPIDCSQEGPVISLGIVTDALSCSQATGSIKVSATQGKEPYEFLLNGTDEQTTGDFIELAAGIYNVSVRDANGCSATVENVSIKADDFNFDAEITPDNACLTGSGKVVINVEQNNPPYQFKIGTGFFGDDNAFSGLQEGNHTIAVQDNNSCIITLSVTVPRGFTGVSWENEIKPIMSTSCALSGCHNGVSRPDLRVYDNAKFYANSIKTKTKDKSMPRDGTLTQQQIDRIACWVDDGALEN